MFGVVSQPPSLDWWTRWAGLTTYGLEEPFWISAEQWPVRSCHGEEKQVEIGRKRGRSLFGWLAISQPFRTACLRRTLLRRTIRHLSVSAFHETSSFNRHPPNLCYDVPRCFHPNLLVRSFCSFKKFRVRFPRLMRSFVSLKWIFIPVSLSSYEARSRETSARIVSFNFTNRD